MMEKTLALTKVALSVMGLFFIIRLTPQIILFVPMVIANYSLELFITALILSLIVGLIIWALIYFSMYNRTFLAKKIIGAEDITDDSSSYPWFPAAMRMGCVFAGLYCLYISATKSAQLLYFVMIYKMSVSDSSLWPKFGADYILPCLLIIPAIYLLFGAPHFVRWQVKKTIEQCCKLESSESASNSE